MRWGVGAMLRAGLVIACLLGLFSNHGVLASGASEADESGMGRSLLGEDAVGSAAGLRKKGIVIRSSSKPASSRTKKETLSDVARTSRQSSVEECAICEDVPPPLTTCEDQVKLGTCSEFFMKGYCKCSCGGCPQGVSSSSASTRAVKPKVSKPKPQGPKKKKNKNTTKVGNTKGPISVRKSEVVVSSNSVFTKESAHSKKPKRSKASASGKEPVEKQGDTEPVCHDIPPPWSYLSCMHQAELLKCDRDWMRGYCLKSCGLCASRDKGELEAHDDPTFVKCPETCNNEPPHNSVSCEEQKTHGKCDRSWMQGYCECTCGKCPALKAQYEDELKEKEAQRLVGPCHGMKGDALEKCKKEESENDAKVKIAAEKPTEVKKGHTRFTIIHFNDFHSRIEPANEFHGECDDYYASRGGHYSSIGLMQIFRSEMKKVIEEERAKAKARGEEVLLLNAGDDFAGTKWDYHYKGNAVAHFFKELGIDAMTLGNHEFDYGPDTVAKFVQKLNYPVISSNMKANGHWLGDLVQDSVVKHVNGTKVGICGTTSQVTMSWSHPWPVQFEDSTMSAKRCVEKMKGMGISIVILLSHEGLNADRYLGRKVPDIDLIIGGHSHAFLSNENPPAMSYSDGKPHRDHIWDGYPAWVDSWIQQGRQVPIVQVGWASRYLGVLTVDFDEDGDLAHISGRPILLGGSASENPVEGDPAVKNEIKS